MTRWFYSLFLLMLGVPALASPQSALAAALEDNRQIPPGAAAYVRYLDASIFPAEYRDEALKSLNFHVNQLSRSPDLAPLRKVNQELWALSTEDYGWDTKVWEKLADVDPYFHVQAVVEKPWYGGIWSGDGRNYAKGSFYYKQRTTLHAPWLNQKQIIELAYRTYSNAPIVRADWFFTQTCRQVDLQNKSIVGYYDFLGIKDRATFQRLIKLNEKDSIEFGKELRAALEVSGVASEGRQIVRFQGLGGGAWGTFDSDSNVDKSNPIRNLGRGDYKHKAEEWYGTLANGLFAYFLGDNNGKRQDSAPDFIGSDDSPLRTGRDAKIHVCLACVRCHVEGLRPIDDWVRRTLRNPAQLQADDYKKFVELKRQYLAPIDGKLEADRLVYATALKEVNGLSPALNAKAFAGLFDWYAQRPRGTAEIAAEMGLAEAVLVEKLKAYAKVNYGKLDLLLVGLLARPVSPLRVSHLEELQPLLWKIAGGY